MSSEDTLYQLSATKGSNPRDFAKCIKIDFLGATIMISKGTGSDRERRRERE